MGTSELIYIYMHIYIKKQNSVIGIIQQISANRTFTSLKTASVVMAATAGHNVEVYVNNTTK